MIWHFLLSKYPIISFNNFFYSRNQLPTQMSAIVFLLTLIPLLFAKKFLVTRFDEIAVDTITFLDILFVNLSKFSSVISDFFPLPYTRSFVRLTVTSRLKSFSSCQTAFLDHMDASIKYLFKGSSASFSFVSSSFTHLWCFQALELFKVSFFHHSP